jgi:hypothetical protein
MSFLSRRQIDFLILWCRRTLDRSGSLLEGAGGRHFDVVVFTTDLWTGQLGSIAKSRSSYQVTVIVFRSSRGSREDQVVGEALLRKYLCCARGCSVHQIPATMG